MDKILRTPEQLESAMSIARSTAKLSDWKIKRLANHPRIAAKLQRAADRAREFIRYHENE